jgi:hypothetical protein
MGIYLVMVKTMGITPITFITKNNYFINIEYIKQQIENEKHEILISHIQRKKMYYKQKYRYDTSIDH